MINIVNIKIGLAYASPILVSDIYISALRAGLHHAAHFAGFALIFIVFLFFRTRPIQAKDQKVEFLTVTLFLLKKIIVSAKSRQIIGMKKEGAKPSIFIYTAQQQFYDIQHQALYLTTVVQSALRLDRYCHYHSNYPAPALPHYCMS